MEAREPEPEPESGKQTPKKYRRSGQPSVSPPLSNFTFVISNGKNGDILAKKIRDADDRHTIRSRVMRHVRARETAAGHKRRNGRETMRKIREDLTSDSSTPASSGGAHAELPKCKSADMQITIMQMNSPVTPTTPDTPLTWAPGVQWVDPFETLYSKNGTGEFVKSLVNYCCEIFIPTTYPIESRDPKERQLRCGFFIQKAAQSATFLAWLAIGAAHRAIAAGRHKDLSPPNENQDHALWSIEYYTLLDESFSVMNQKTARQEFGDSDVFEAHFALAGATASAGNFVEARRQIMLSKECRRRIGVEPEAGGLPWWLAGADNKAASGRLQAPLYAHAPDPHLAGDRALARIIPPANSPLSRLAINFEHVPELSAPLRSLLQDLRTLCYFVEFDATSQDTITPLEQYAFRTKVLDLEHFFLKYPHHLHPEPVNNEDVVLEPIETMTRIAALTLLSQIGIIVQPAAGVGRSLTWNQAKAIRRWLASPSSKYADSMTLELVVWILFIALEGAEGHIEEAFFKETTADIIRRRGWVSWKEVADSMQGFLYTPSLQQTRWYGFWESVIAGKSEVRAHSTAHGIEFGQQPGSTRGEGEHMHAFAQS